MREPRRSTEAAGLVGSTEELGIWVLTAVAPTNQKLDQLKQRNGILIFVLCHIHNTHQDWLVCINPGQA
jgi:predicted phosphodiesterase